MENSIKANKNSTRNCFIFFFIFLILSCKAQNQTMNEILYASVRFEDHFNDDTLDLYLNEQLVLTSALLNSDKSDGLTNIIVDIYKQEDGHFIVIWGSTQKIKFAVPNDHLNIFIILNGIRSSYSVELNKGKYIGFSNDGKGNLMFTQKAKRPIYD